MRFLHWMQRNTSRVERGGSGGSAVSRGHRTSCRGGEDEVDHGIFLGTVTLLQQGRPTLSRVFRKSYGRRFSGLLKLLPSLLEGLKRWYCTLFSSYPSSAPSRAYAHHNLPGGGWMGRYLISLWLIRHVLGEHLCRLTFHWVWWCGYFIPGLISVVNSPPSYWRLKERKEKRGITDWGQFIGTG